MAAVDLSDQVNRVTVDQLRAVANRLFQASSYALVAINTFVAWVGGQDATVAFIISSLAATSALVAISVYGIRPAARVTVAISFAIQLMVTIFSASNLNTAYIEEAHMVYAVLNLYLLAYACWRSLLVYNLVVIFHHILLTFLMPKLVWAAASASEGIYHLAIHALLGTTLVLPLLYTAEQLRRTLLSNEKALKKAGLAMNQACATAHQADLEREAAERRAAIVQETAGGIDGELQSLFKNILDAALEVGQSAKSVATVSRSCGDNTDNVERLLERTSSNIDGVAQSADALAQSVIEIAERAEAAAQKAQNAVAESVQASRLIEALNASGQKVGDITRIIRTVAESINLLALNATIEAARAGEAGLGFAVVAQSVKTLAGQTAKATEDISSVIRKIQDETHAAVQAVNAIGETIASAHNHASEIAASTAGQKTITASIAKTAATISHEAADVRSQVSATLKLLVSANTMSNDLLNASGGLRQVAEISTEQCVTLLARLRQA